MHTVTYIGSDGLTNTIELPIATSFEDEPVMDGFEAVARAAAHESDLVLVEDWLLAIEAA